MHELALTEVVALLRSGDLKAERYAAALLERCGAWGKLNAWITLDPDAVLATAREADLTLAKGARPGLLHGVPLAIKDNINTAGMRTTGGTAALASWTPRLNAGVLRRLIGQGAFPLGKSNLHELAMGWTSNNPHYGRVRNPHAPERLAGGSSGGSACAVAAMMAPAAIGTDTNGSIRIPSSLCGIAGLRPSLGRYPLDGVIRISHSLDTVGPMARCVGDLSLLDAVMSGLPVGASRRGLAGIRIALSPAYFFDDLDASVAEVLDQAKRSFVTLGATIVDLEVPDLKRWVDDVAPVLISYESRRCLTSYLEAHGTGVGFDQLAEAAGPDVAALLRRSPGMSPTKAEASAYSGALELREQMRKVLGDYFRAHKVDALLHPVLPVAAPLAVDRWVSPAPDIVREGGAAMTARDAFARFVSPASVAGLPSLVMCAGSTSSGLPVGIQLDGPEGSDSGLLALGAALEAALGPRTRAPRIKLDLETFA